MLDLDRIDLGELCSALEDHSGDTEWWLDTRTGELHILTDSMWDGEEVEDDFEPPEGVVRVEPIASRESYGDLEDFTARVRDPKARDLLERAIAGRGAFRRFKDVLHEFPDLRSAWFAFHDARMERRAIEWLRDEGVIGDADAERAIAARADPEPPPISGPFDARTIAGRVAADLRTLYGARLRTVLLFGSWARGDAHPESDIDLLMVLDRVDDVWAEHDRIEDVLYRHSLDNVTVVSALIVSEADLEHPRTPAVMRARREAVAVG
jgi:predicted nucleotidyltransferase